MVIKGHLLTVGPKIYGTIVFIHFSSQDALILKFSVPITIKLSHDNLDKMRVYKNPDDIQVCSKFNSISKNCCFVFWKCHNLALNHPNLTSRRFFESSGPLLDDGQEP